MRAHPLGRNDTVKLQNRYAVLEEAPTTTLPVPKGTGILSVPGNSGLQAAKASLKITKPP